MFHHVPYSDDEAAYQLARLNAARGHATALNGLGVLLACVGVAAATATAFATGALAPAFLILAATVLLDLARGHWSRELIAHVDAGIYDLQILDADSLAALTRECGRHPTGGQVLDRWIRQRFTLRQRDARALSVLVES